MAGSESLCHIFMCRFRLFSQVIVLSAAIDNISANKNNALKFYLFLRLKTRIFFFFCTAKQVINAYIVIICQLYKDFYRYIDFAKFVFGVSRLFDIQVICQFNLFLIIIFS